MDFILRATTDPPHRHAENEVRLHHAGSFFLRARRGDVTGRGRDPTYRDHDELTGWRLHLIDGHIQLRLAVAAESPTTKEVTVENGRAYRLPPRWAPRPRVRVE